MRRWVFPLLLVFSAMATVAGAATYYVRTDGTAANKGAATSCGAVGTAMSVATHNGETFAAGDTVCVCSDGGTVTSQVLPPSSGSSGSPITYDGDCDTDGVMATIDAEVIGASIRLDDVSWIVVRQFNLIDNRVQGGYGLRINDVSENNIIEYITATGNEDVGILVGDNLDGVNLPNNNTVRYCTASNNGGEGIYVVNATNTLVEHNVTRDNGDDAAGDGGSDCIDVKQNSSDTTVQYNTCRINSGSSGGAINVHGESSIARYNTVTVDGGTNVAAIWTGQSSTGSTEVTDVQIYYNVLIGTANATTPRGVFISHADAGEPFTGLTIYNNSIYKMRTGVYFNYGGAGANGPPTGTTIKNNIISNDAESYALYVHTSLVLGNILAGCDYNIYDTIGVSNYVISGTVKTWSEWTALGYEANGQQADPLFRDAPGANFRLSGDSPAIDAGADVSLTADYLGNPVPVNATPDIGALEYVGGTQATQATSNASLFTRMKMRTILYR